MEAKLSPEELESLYTELLENGAALTIANIVEVMLILWAFEAD